MFEVDSSLHYLNKEWNKSLLISNRQRKSRLSSICVCICFYRDHLRISILFSCLRAVLIRIRERERSHGRMMTTHSHLSFRLLSSHFLSWSGNLNQHLLINDISFPYPVQSISLFIQMPSVYSDPFVSLTDSTIEIHHYYMPNRRVRFSFYLSLKSKSSFSLVR